MNKDPKRQVRGSLAKAAGDRFEAEIDMACEYYRRNGMAEIKKTPEPMRPIRDLGQGKFVAHFEAAAQPDYKGTLKGGKSVVFEAKASINYPIYQSRVTEQQALELDKHQRLGAVCFILVSIAGDYYRIPWSFWRTMKQRYNHKHMTKGELEMFLLAYKSGVIHFLSGMEKRTEEEDEKKA